MTACDVLKEEAKLAYTQLSEILEPISEGQAWAMVPLAPGEYLHTNDAIIGMVQHITVCKVMYASHAFRGTETRWRECMDRLEAIGTSGTASVDTTGRRPTNTGWPLGQTSKTPTSISHTSISAAGCGRVGRSSRR